MNLKDSYKAMYKCRLCGKVFSYVTTDYAGAMETATDLVINECGRASERLIMTPYGPVNMTIRQNQTHACAGEHVGFADFIGFRRVGACGE